MNDLTKNITILLSANPRQTFSKNYKELKGYVAAENIFVCSDTLSLDNVPSSQYIQVKSTLNGKALKEALARTQTKFLLLVLPPDVVELNADTLQSFVNRAEADNATLVFAAHQSQEGVQPLIDYQFGSVRDDFNFGALILIDTKAAKEVVSKYPQLLPDDSAVAWYGLRLALALKKTPVRIQEVLYTVKPQEIEDQEKAHFSYVDPANRTLQKELEVVFTHYAKVAGFFLPQVKKVEVFKDDFEYEASVIIPVKNRVSTISDAVISACSQITDFKFNVIVVDNYSDDGTTAILDTLEEKYPQLRHVIPAEVGLAIGGCWNVAIADPECGKFAVQLDSDDLYIDHNTLQTIVDCFRRERCAAVVGAYRLVDKDLNEIPPGVIDHREWSDENGHNNGLRINGFGAPRAFYTPLARAIKFPNVSYGEDYAMMLAVTRSHKIARIYDPLYLCRRWEGNSDSKLSIEKGNRFNAYKDELRTNEILKRIEEVKSSPCHA